MNTEIPSHHCHWPRCPAEVEPHLWGCKKHWLMLPKQIRRDIWRCYRRGQEITKDPSPDYVWAASRAREWIYENYPTARPSAPATLADVWPEVHA